MHICSLERSCSTHRRTSWRPHIFENNTSPSESKTIYRLMAGSDDGSEGSDKIQRRRRWPRSSYGHSGIAVTRDPDSKPDDQESISSGAAKPRDLSHVTCHKCNQKGHYANRCPNEQNANHENELDSSISSSESSDSSKSSEDSRRSSRPC